MAEIGKMSDGARKRLQQDIEALEREAYQRGLEDGYQMALEAMAKADPRKRGRVTSGIVAPGGTVASTVPVAPSVFVASTSPRGGFGFTGAAFTSGPTMPRGFTKMIVADIVRELAPNPITPTGIIKAAEERGKGRLADSSVSRDLKKLVDEGVVERVGDTPAVRYAAKLRAVEK